MLARLLEPLLKHVYQGMSDDNIDVRNAAMFALGQFAVHLQVRRCSIFFALSVHGYFVFFAVRVHDDLQFVNDALIFWRHV